MTEYGRGQGSEPWHPEDPYYGDDGWGGQQAQAGQQSPYGGQPQHYPEQQQAQHQQQYGDWGQQGGQQPQYDQQQYGQQHQQQYYANQGYQQGYDNSGWGTGAHGQVPYPDPSDPYGQQAAAAYGQQQDYYGTPEAYPPPEPPGRRRAEPAPEPEPEPEPRTDWDPGPDRGEHAFFAGRDDDDDDLDDDAGDRRSRGERRARGGKSGKGGKKRRSGCACLVVLLVFGGGVAGVGYFGYQFYQDRFAEPEDYAGGGNGEQVTVEIPKGAGGYAIGQELKAKGVVKSVDAFVAAQQKNPKGKSIQAGVYTLEREMSAEAAVAMMLSPESQSNLIIPEGTRNVRVYEMIDARLELDKGTTKKVAAKKWESFGLPDWALNHENVKDPLEGFLYPSSYPVAKGQKPEAVLKDMVERATEQYEKLGLEKKAKGLGLDGPWELLTVASLAQAEGTSHDDFRKMAEVVYNRLEKNNPETYGSLEFDSTYNYIKNQSKIDLSIEELRKFNNPYNTYFVKGLPPGPIDNPGEEALKGALNPTDDGWYYFISLDGKTSKFTKTLAEHDKLVQEFNASR
ncbi:endolytic transglycosylase MltG [Streptomyces sp. FZ201]|uniref:endolytic transglycosylase MltG n=1 Tax=Streptomyces sp. FZ201 TaxID=3057122 RepID=UPI0021C1B3E8|nr:endolytic transglycosylase MltG [Streptomyces sp. FZ201]